MRIKILFFSVIGFLHLISFSQDSLWKSLKDNNYTNNRTAYTISTRGNDIIAGGSFKYFGRISSEDMDQVQKLAI